MEIGRVSVILVLAAALTACSRLESLKSVTSQNSPQLLDLGDLHPATPNNPQTPSSPEAWKGLSICSALDFKGLTWSKNVEINERDPFALALNISGSFEGHNGWANLTNNFDGQGISMGLLNQNLGQGSLQPMWIEMQNSAPSTLASLFSGSNYSSMIGMLNRWQSSVSSSMIDVHDYGYSDLDDLTLVAKDMGLDQGELQAVQSALLARNQTAVNWAKATVYTGSSFKTDWSKSLKAMANSAVYRSIQVRKAERLHNAALELMDSLRFTQLNAYLFFFDVAVQNGGLSSTVRNAYKTWAAKNPKASEETRLKKILELRLGTVIKTYVPDVRARKTAIIDGSGTVHGSKRQFGKEFCADINSSF